MRTRPGCRRGCRFVSVVSVVSVVAGLVVLGFVVAGVGIYRRLDRRGSWSQDFVIANETSEPLRDVRLIAEREWTGASSWTISEISEVRAGATVTAPFDRTVPFKLRVELTTAHGRHVWRSVHYVDGDEWGDRDVVIRNGPQLFAFPASRSPVAEEPR